MFVLPLASQDPGLAPEVPAGDLLGHLGRLRRNENISACAQTVVAAGIWYERMREEHEIVAAGGEVTVGNSVYAEIAVVLGCSATVAHTLVEIGTVLPSRYPSVYGCFDAGEVDLARVKTVVSVLRDAGAATVAAIETEVCAAARRLTPGPLRTELWRLWCATDPVEAAAARERAARTDRTVYVRRGDNGLSWLSACITDLEGVEADRLLDEIAATVCPADPRSRATLRADGLMALLHGEPVLVCRCSTTGCPRGGMVPPPRRGYLAQVLIDVHTLLGLSATPARLADGTPLDPELARTLAEDATWQAILTELQSTARQLADTENTDNTSGASRDAGRPGETGDTRTSSDTDETGTTDPPAGTDVPGASRVSGVADGPNQTGAAGGPRSPSWTRCVARGRLRLAGVLGPAPMLVRSPVGVGSRIDAVLGALDRDPGLCRGVDPFGHGGHRIPPSGALTYRVSAEVAVLVRATYPTCVFPGCAVVSVQCELDHRVAFDHDAPLGGGWTVPENLQPLCKRHHDIKTRRLWNCVVLDGGVILWTSPTGTQHVTLPDTALIDIPEPPRDPEPVETELVHLSEPYRDDELLYEPTWWERFIGDDADIVPLDPYLDHHYRQHRAIQAARQRLQPAPF